MEPTAHSVVDGGTLTPEDRLTVFDRAAWVLDGTSGFTDRSVTSHPESDGVWFVETADAYLRDHVYDDAPLEEIVARTIEHVAGELVAEATVEPEVSLSPPRVEDAGSMEEMPAATIALVRWDEDADTLEYYSLGDSAVVVATQDGEVDYHDQSGPEAFDRVLRRRVEEYVAGNPDADYDEVREAVRPHIREMRSYREVPGGFWCLGLNPVSARQALAGEYALSETDSVTLFTDGFTQAVTVFELYDDWAEVVADVERRGVEAVVEDLRVAQRTADLRERPRIKPMDDVAMVHLDYPAESGHEEAACGAHHQHQ